MKAQAIQLPEDFLRTHPKIRVDPEIMGGYPCIQGTRIPAYVVLDLIEAGCSFDEILSEYHTLQKEDIEASVSFASDLTARATCAHSPG